MTNTGSRAGREVIQAYHEPPGDDPTEPSRTLAAFAPVTAAPGETVTARLTLPVRAFTRWSERTGGWVRPAGEHVIRIGRSSRDLPLRLVIPPPAAASRPSRLGDRPRDGVRGA